MVTAQDNFLPFIGTRFLPLCHPSKFSQPAHIFLLVLELRLSINRAFGLGTSRSHGADGAAAFAEAKKAGGTSGTFDLTIEFRNP